eukprot:m.356748 g.356748  ORF g.356748 m.356748 type:complete len:344 (-) comp17615_c0_seq1:169-1200(-)
MSHQTGIQCSEELKTLFSEAQNSDTFRMMKVIIDGETLVSTEQRDVEGDWEADYDSCVLPALEEKAPCYILYKLDTQNSSGYDFVFLAWSPDFAHIKAKMLYAATRATFKQTFGTRYIKDEVFGTVVDDVNLSGYQKHLTCAAAPPPLTMEEMEKAEIKKAETGVEIGAGTKRQVATGVAFPLEEAAIQQLQALKEGKVTYVQLDLDLTNETVTLVSASSDNVHAIAAQIPDDHARYHVFNFQHNHEGDNLDSIVFVYSCPGYKCSVKERMMFSTCKAPVIDFLEGSLSMDIQKKLEISEGSEFTQEFLYDALHPAKVVFKQQFSRPKGPGRGPRRMTRKQAE